MDNPDDRAGTVPDGGLAPGLYLVATPIGNARDITLRALDVLAAADVLAAEDTRNTRRLMDIHGISLNGRRLIPYHDHNATRQRPKLIAMLNEGLSVACVSDAGTPLIADPGFGLARAAIDAGLPVSAVPGASALLAALSVAGLPTDRFAFAGFLPPKKAARRKALAGLATAPGSLVLFESPRRIKEMLEDLVAILGANRKAALCRELTKKFEQVRRGALAELAAGCADDPPKGEIVLVIAPPAPRAIGTVEIDAALATALSGGGTLRDAVDAVARDLGAPRRVVYARALEQGRSGG